MSSSLHRLSLRNKNVKRSLADEMAAVAPPAKRQRVHEKRPVPFVFPPAPTYSDSDEPSDIVPTASTPMAPRKAHSAQPIPLIADDSSSDDSSCYRCSDDSKCCSSSCSSSDEIEIVSRPKAKNMRVEIKKEPVRHTTEELVGALTGTRDALDAALGVTIKDLVGLRAMINIDPDEALDDVVGLSPASRSYVMNALAKMFALHSVEVHHAVKRFKDSYLARYSAEDVE